MRMQAAPRSLLRLSRPPIAALRCGHVVPVLETFRYRRTEDMRVVFAGPQSPEARNVYCLCMRTRVEVFRPWKDSVRLFLTLYLFQNRPHGSQETPRSLAPQDLNGLYRCTTACQHVLYRSVSYLSDFIVPYNALKASICSNLSRQRR